MPIDEFCDLLDMIVNLLRHMGTAMSLASNGKSDRSRNNGVSNVE